MRRHKRSTQKRQWSQTSEALETRELRTVVTPEMASKAQTDVGETFGGAHRIQTELQANRNAMIQGWLNRAGGDTDTYSVNLLGGQQIEVRNSENVDVRVFDAWGRDVNNGHSVANGAFTVPADGTYFFAISELGVEASLTDANPSRGGISKVSQHDLYVLFMSSRQADAGSSLRSAHDLMTAPMLEQTVNGTVGTMDDDVYRVDARSGDFIAVTSAHVTETEILDAYGKVLTSGRHQLGYRVEKSGSFYVRERSLLSGESRSVRNMLKDLKWKYSTKVQVVGTADETNARTRNHQASDAELHAWLEGDTLQLTGPTGHSIAIESDSWNVEHYGSGNDAWSTYTVTDSVHVESLFPDFDIPLPPGVGFSVTTEPGAFGHEFGVVDNVQLELAGVSLEQIGMLSGGIGGMLQDELQSMTEWSLLSRTPGLQVGIALGGDLNLDLPLSGSVPYFYFVAEGSPEVKVGDVSFETGKRGLAIAVDPLDAVFVSVPEMNDLALGVSIGGNINYTPTNRPEHWDNDLTGHLYAKGSVKFYEVFKAEGDVVLDLDANDDGYALGHLNLENLAQGEMSDADSERFSNLLALDADTLEAMVDDIAAGVNGKVSVAVEKSGIGVTIPMGTASLIADMTDGAYFNGSSVNPFEDVVVLEQFGTTNEFITDGHYRNTDDFRVRVSGQMAVGPFDGAEGYVQISNQGIIAEAQFNVAGIHAEVSGVIDANGFDLTGHTGVDWGIIEARAEFELSYRDHQFAFSADVQARLDLKVAGMGVTGTLDADLRFSAGKKGLEIAGSGRVEGRVHALFFSVGVGVGIGFDNNGFEIDLPVVPNLRVRW